MWHPSASCPVGRAAGGASRRASWALSAGSSGSSSKGEPSAHHGDSGSRGASDLLTSLAFAVGGASSPVSKELMCKTDRKLLCVCTWLCMLVSTRRLTGDRKQR